MQHFEAMEYIHGAGFSEEEVIEAAAVFIRDNPLLFRNPPANALTADEARELKAIGMIGIDDDASEALEQNRLEIMAEYSVMVQTALTPKDAEKLLNVNASRLRQRISEGSLYTVPGNKGRVLPSWQFCEDGDLPGLKQILAVIPSQAHPLRIQSFFLTPNVDLQVDEGGPELSPRDWLLSGASIEPVLILAADL